MNLIQGRDTFLLDSCVQPRGLHCNCLAGIKKKTGNETETENPAFKKYYVYLFPAALGMCAAARGRGCTRDRAERYTADDADVGQNFEMYICFNAAGHFCPAAGLCSNGGR